MARASSAAHEDIGRGETSRSYRLLARIERFGSVESRAESVRGALDRPRSPADWTLSHRRQRRYELLPRVKVALAHDDGKNALSRNRPRSHQLVETTSPLRPALFLRLRRADSLPGRIDRTNERNRESWRSSRSPSTLRSTPRGSARSPLLRRTFTLCHDIHFLRRTRIRLSQFLRIVPARQAAPDGPFSSARKVL